MKLWTTIPFTELPEVLKSGLTGVEEEIIFYDDASGVAEEVLEYEGELAFIETEIPDEDVDFWFTYCVMTTSDMATDAETELGYAIEAEQVDDEEIAARQAWIQKLHDMETGRQSFDALGFGCLLEPMPPQMLKLLNPEAMLEAQLTEDFDTIAEAVETTESEGFTTLSSGFWVWLMMFMAGLLGPDWGTRAEEEAAEKKAKKRRARRRAVKKKTKGRPRKKKRPRRKTRAR